MISKQIKQAILNGKFALTRGGHKVKFIGKANSLIQPYMFAYFKENDVIEHVLNLKEDLQRFSHEENEFDIVGLWEDRIDPFNLARALKGEPVKLRNGAKAFVKYVMPSDFEGSYPINGFMKDPNDLGVYVTRSWNLEGKYNEGFQEHAYDIIGMWKEPKTKTETVNPTLPRPLERPSDEMWFISFVWGEPVKSTFDKYSISQTDFARGIYFASREEAQAWLDAIRGKI